MDASGLRTQNDDNTLCIDSARSLRKRRKLSCAAPPSLTFRDFFDAAP